VSGPASATVNGDAPECLSGAVWILARERQTPLNRLRLVEHEAPSVVSIGFAASPPQHRATDSPTGRRLDGCWVRRCRRAGCGGTISVSIRAGGGWTDGTAEVRASGHPELLDLVDAVEHAVAHTRYTTESHHLHQTGWEMRWGVQLDIRPVRVPSDREITDGMVAGYLAKYATKSTEAAGHLSKRLTTDTIDLYADPKGTHVERLIHACWQLGGYVPGQRLSDQATRPYGRLRKWAHMLGFGGHFLTKSRRYSITFRILRENRVVYRRQAEVEQHEEETTLVATLTYAGSGWRTTGDALLANTSAAMARERQYVGRLEDTSLN
jgi:hypothetical protein